MIHLGNTVRDVITGFAGIAMSRIEYLTGCTQIGVCPRIGADGKPIEWHYFDLQRLEYIDEGVVLPAYGVPEINLGGSAGYAAKGGPSTNAPKGNV